MVIGNLMLNLGHISKSEAKYADARDDYPRSLDLYDRVYGDEHPQQALVLLNDPTYVEAARAFATRIVTEADDSDEARLAWAFQQALQRLPRVEEQETLLPLLVKHRAAYRADPDAAKQLVATGQAAVQVDLNVAELAAWTHIARVLFNLHETITRS